MVWLRALHEKQQPRPCVRSFSPVGPGSNPALTYSSSGFYLLAMHIHIFIYLYYIATRCLRVCLRTISSETAGPIWLNFFLLAPSWSRDGFRPKIFRIRDPIFP